MRKRLLRWAWTLLTLPHFVFAVNLFFFFFLHGKNLLGLLQNYENNIHVHQNQLRSGSKEKLRMVACMYCKAYGMCGQLHVFSVYVSACASNATIKQWKFAIAACL